MQQYIAECAPRAIEPASPEDMGYHGPIRMPGNTGTRGRWRIHPNGLSREISVPPSRAIRAALPRLPGMTGIGK